MKWSLILLPLILLLAAALAFASLAGLPSAVWGAAALQGPLQQPEPTPTVDRLAIPVLPEHPTELELGRSLYYYHCMPCHGDYGQGLTDEFRGIWEEDHQNCWRRGCHGGREKDEGFPLPTTIPAVKNPKLFQRYFSKPDDLYAYLRSTHPPQRPGALKEEEYRALTVYLFHMNGLPISGAYTVAEGFALSLMNILRLALLVLFLWLGGWAIVRWRQNRRSTLADPLDAPG